MSQKSINHHYVPQGLLKKWYAKNSDKKNQGFRKYQRKYNGEVSLIPDPCSSKSSCSENHLNTLYKNVFSITEELVEDTNTIEHSFHDLDTNALVLINSIIESPVDKIDTLNSDEKSLLSKFILSLHFRHPETIQYAKNLLEQKADIYFNYISGELAKYEIENNLDYFKKNINLTSMRSILEDSESHRVFFDMDIQVVVSENDFFFSGEKPLVLNFCKDEVIPSLGYALALSPKVLLIGCHREFLKGEKIKFQDFINKFIVHYNRIICEQSRYVISTDIISEELQKMYLDGLLM